MSREEKFEDLADTLGEASFAYSEFDPSDEATTCIKRGTSVDEVAEYLIAAGWRKFSLDDATVERAARAIFPSYWDDDASEHFETPEALAEAQKGCTDHVRSVLAAAVEAGQ